MPFVYDPKLGFAIDRERELTFNVTGFNKEQEAQMSLSHRDGSGVRAMAYAGEFSPAFREKINLVKAAYAETWVFAIVPWDSYRIGDTHYTQPALTALLQDAADAFAYRMIHKDGDVLLAEVITEY